VVSVELIRKTLLFGVGMSVTKRKFYEEVI
jgi:hypothetical protein